MMQLDLTDEAVDDAAELPPRLGRKRDHTRDPEILDAALEVLAEEGYDGMTIDMVAARAKAGKATLYRRWPSKGELVIDAIACMKSKEVDVAALPDTGTLRGDLLAMIKPHTIQDSERKLQVMAGLMSMLSRAPELADAVNAAIVEPRAAVNRILLRRAVERGEISADCDIDALALISPSMTAYRLLMLRQPVDSGFLVSLIDGVVLPAVGLRPPSSAGASQAGASQAGASQAGTSRTATAEAAASEAAAPQAGQPRPVAGASQTGQGRPASGTVGPASSPG